MAASLEIHDLYDVGQVQVLLVETSGESRETPPRAFSVELSEEERGALDRYHTEYREGSPGGIAQIEAVELAMRNLGRLLFESAFAADTGSREILDEVMGRDDRAVLTLVSSRPEFMSLPWELMNDPSLGYFINGLVGVVRQSLAEVPVDDVEEVEEDTLHVLMLSASPLALEVPSSGPLLAEPVAAGGSLADATVAALEGLNVQVSLDNPRPATLKALQDLLAHSPNHYHVAHIDGATLGDDGTILLEQEDGSPNPVAATALGETLASGGVNVALITAGVQEEFPPSTGWAEAAMAVAEAGVSQVAVVPAPMHPDTGENAVATFYRRIAQGNTVAEAVAALRRGLMDTPERVTMYGRRVFWDWQLPSVYQSRSHQPPGITQHQPDPLAPPVIHPEEAPTEDLQIPVAGQYGLIGRQAELRQLERALKTHSVVHLSGDTGVGKTELALGLCRWFLKPARVAYPGGVFYAAFETSQPAGLERVVHEIGTAVSGLDFADMPATQQQRWVTAYLQENASLLVWDNVENVAGFPDGAPGLLNEQELPDLAAFLGEVTTGPVGTSALLSGRRVAEEWVSVPHASLTLDGLAGTDRLALAAQIMHEAEVPASRTGADFEELLDLLDGHPLSMQIAIPPVKDVPAAAVVSEMARLIESDPDGGEAGRGAVLTAAMEYSFSRMSRRNRTHLPFLSLFQRRVMLDVLSHMTEERAYGQIVGDDLTAGASRSLLTPDGGIQSTGRSYAACRTMLRSAHAAGLLESISPSVYQINPSMPWFLGRKLGRQVSGNGIQQLEMEFVRVYADTADYFMESLYENQDTGVTAVLAEEGNLTQALGLALEYRQWDNAQVLFQPLAQVYRMQKRFPELRRLRGQLLDTIGHTASEAEGNGAIEFWQYLLGTDAMESVERMDLERADLFNRQLLDYLLEQPDGETDARTAAVYHQNGLISTRRGQYDTASEWLEKGLEIIDGGEDQESIADACFAIGQVRHHQRQYGAAKEWYSRALDIHQRLPDYEEMINDFRALGSACHLRFEYEEARSWYHRAREMVEENRDEETAVYIFHSLGTVDHSEYLFEDAQSWYQQALGLSDRLGMTEQMIVEFHHLGTLAQARGIADEADEWLRVAMEYREEMGDVRGVGVEARQLGVVHHEQGDLDQAYHWYDQARVAFESVRDVLRAARTYGQLGMVEEERGNLPDALEWVARTYQLAADHQLPMMVQVKAHLARLKERMGDDPFAQWWRDNTGAEPPTDLDVDASEIL
jgi:tetratricopeptide (TPR) repeat protein